MCDAGELEDTPSLINPDVSRDIRRELSAISVGGRAGRAADHRTCRSTQSVSTLKQSSWRLHAVGWINRGKRKHIQIAELGAVKHEAFIEPDRGRHAVAKLLGVLDVVHAGHVVGTADQERRIVVTTITIPR